jgi:outer membrane protein assembly factor BamB
VSRHTSSAARLRTCLLVAALCLSACGGGDGDGGSGGSKKPSLSVSPRELNVTADSAVSGQPSATITVTVRNPSPNGTAVGGRYTTNGIQNVYLDGSGTQGTLTVVFQDPTVIGEGTYTDTVELAICSNDACSEVEEDTVVTIPVTYRVTVVSTVTLSANPETTGPGVPTTLTWTSTDATTCTASGEWSGTLPSSGSRSVTPETLGDHVYTLTCSDPGAPGEASVTVTALEPEVTLTAFPSTVVLGKPVTLRWNGAHTSGCVASGDWSGSLPASGFQTLTLGATGTLEFHIDCSSGSGSGEDDVSVTVEAAPAAPPATAYRMSENHDGVLRTSDGITHPATSTPTWQRDFSAPVSYPLIAAGRVFITTAMPDDSYGNQLYALDAATGATIWGPVTIAGVYFGSGLTYHDGRVFVLMFDGVVSAFDASNGAPLWATQLPGYWYEASPNAYGGLVFVNGNGGMSALDEVSGAIRWTTQAAGTTGWASPSVSSEGVYTQAGACNAGAYDPVTGDALWENRSPCDQPWDYAPVIKNGIFFGRVGGSLNLFDAASGEFLVQLGSARAPAVTDSAVLAVNADTLSSTRLADYAQDWTFSGAGAIVTAPVVVNDTVFVATDDSKIHGLDVLTGAETWTGQSPVAINYDSENGGPMPPAGPAAGEHLLVFPAGKSIVAWELQ